MNLDADDLPPNVIATIQGARAQSTRNKYAIAWRVFQRWCSSRPGDVVPHQARVSVILTFLQSFLDDGKSFAAVKLNLAAISACHVGFNGKTVWKHPLVRQFMKGASRLHQVSRTLVPPWDLTLVLDALTQAPFEPLEAVGLKHLTLKTALLVALTSAKRVSDLHALSISPECMQFNDDNSRVTIRPNPAFVPKNFLAPSAPVDLKAFHPPPFNSESEKRLNSLCPVRALRLYIDRTSPSRRGHSQLFVAWNPRTIGRPITKVRLSQWIVEAIRIAYTSKGVQPPEVLRAHSTRGVSTSWALLKGVSIQEVCTAASWSSTSTFARYYNLDMAAPPVAHAVLAAATR